LKLSKQDVSLLVTALGEHNPKVLASITASRHISPELSELVVDSLIDCFLTIGLQPDSEPNEIGRRLDDLAGQIRWAFDRGESVGLDPGIELPGEKA